MGTGEKLVSILWLAVIVCLAAKVGHTHRINHELFHEHFRFSTQAAISATGEIAEKISSDAHAHRMHKGAIPKVNELRSLCATLRDTIEQLKIRTEAAGGSKQTAPMWKTDLTADALQQCMAAGSKQMLQLANPRDSDGLKRVLPLFALADISPHIDGSYRILFRHQPREAAVSLLGLLQQAVTDCETVMLSYLYINYRMRGDHFSHMYAFALPQQAFIAAHDTARFAIAMADIAPRLDASRLTASTGSMAITDGPVQGPQMVRWRGVAGKTGLHTITGSYRVSHVDTDVVVPWSFSYLSLAPGASLHIDNMGHCYRHVAHTLQIAVPGYGPGNITVQATGGSIRKTGHGQYQLMAGAASPGHIIVRVVTQAVSSTAIPLGNFRLKVLDMPPPRCIIAGSVDDSLNAAALKNASLAFISFDTSYAIDYRVGSYTFSAVGKDGLVTGPYKGYSSRLNGGKEIAEAIEKLSPGDKIIIEDIQATYAGNVVVNAPPVIVNVR